MYDDSAVIILSRTDHLTGQVERLRIPMTWLEPWRPFYEEVMKLEKQYNAIYVGREAEVDSP